jgi:hypothetical protein
LEKSTSKYIAIFVETTLFVEQMLACSFCNKCALKKLLSGEKTLRGGSSRLFANARRRPLAVSAKKLNISFTNPFLPLLIGNSEYNNKISNLILTT